MKKVLIIEDDVDLLSLLNLLMEKSDTFEILIAKNFKEGKAKLAEHNIDVLITDIRLPDGDGLDLVKQANSGVKKPSTVIVFSGQNRYSQADFKAAGVSKVFNKPSDLKTLTDYLDSLK